MAMGIRISTAAATGLLALAGVVPSAAAGPPVDSDRTAAEAAAGDRHGMNGRGAVPGMERMHELMAADNPGMERMHELMAADNPGMERMHELMAADNPGMERMHEQMMDADTGMSPGPKVKENPHE